MQTSIAIARAASRVVRPVIRRFSKKAETPALSNADITKYFLELDAATGTAPVSDLPIKLTGRSGELIEAIYNGTSKTKGAFEKIVKELESVSKIISSSGLVIDRFFSTTNYSPEECKMVAELLLTDKEPLNSFDSIKNTEVRELLVDNEANVAVWKNTRKELNALNLSPEVKNLFNTLASEARLDLVKKATEKAVDLRAALSKSVDVQVASAVPLSKEQQAAVTKALPQYAPAGSSINVNYVVDNNLLGGLLVTLKNQTVDLSVSTRLVEVQQAKLH